MKISDKSIAILSNFSKINPSIKIIPGSVLSTKDHGNFILAIANVEEEFPQECCIYELPKLLNILPLIKDPDFEFGSHVLNIKSSTSSSKLKYAYCSEDVIAASKYKAIAVNDVAVEFDLSEEDLGAIIKAVNILSLPSIAFSGESGTLYVKSVDPKDSNSNEFKIKLGDIDTDFITIFNPEKLKYLFSDDYHVTITERAVTKFEGNTISYWIAAESNG
jgi:hypothetical protein